MSVKRLPLLPMIAPECTASMNSSIFDSNGAGLRPVNRFTGKHRIDRGRHTRLFRQPRKQLARRAVDMIFRIIERQVAGRQ
jgi:hypothetical protein